MFWFSALGSPSEDCSWWPWVTCLVQEHLTVILPGLDQGLFEPYQPLNVFFLNLKQSAAPSVNMTEPTSCRFRLGQQMNPWPHSTNVANVVIAGGNNTGYNFQKKNYFPSLLKSIRKNHSTPRGDCTVLPEKEEFSKKVSRHKIDSVLLTTTTAVCSLSTP